MRMLRVVEEVDRHVFENRESQDAIVNGTYPVQGNASG